MPLAALRGCRRRRVFALGLAAAGVAVALRLGGGMITAFTSVGPSTRHSATQAAVPSAAEVAASEEVAGAAQSRRRQLLVAAASGAMSAGLTVQPVGAVSDDVLISEIQKDRSLLDPLPGLLKKEAWDQVRSVLKLPPVGNLWNLGASKNPLKALGVSRGDPDLLELNEDIAGALQLADQFTYDNVFAPFQPGPGKLKIKEPIEQVEVAMEKLDAVLKAVK